MSTTKGSRVHDVVTDINPLARTSKERTGYPTQKPTELYKRFITASSNEGDLILDPFCGCGTTLVAAEELNRHWIGIDLTYLSTGAVKLQIEKFFPQLRNEIRITGTPENAERALELARTDPHGFEEWCVTHVLNFKANARRGGDGGIDGTFRFPLGRERGRQAYGKAVAQVKGGNYTLGHIRDFRTAMQNVEADVGVFRRNITTNTRDANRGFTCWNIPTPVFRYGSPAPTNLRDTRLFQRCFTETALWRKNGVINEGTRPLDNNVLDTVQVANNI